MLKKLKSLFGFGKKEEVKNIDIPQVEEKNEIKEELEEEFAKDSSEVISDKTKDDISGDKTDLTENLDEKKVSSIKKTVEKDIVEKKLVEEELVEEELVEEELVEEELVEEELVEEELVEEELIEEELVEEELVEEELVEEESVEEESVEEQWEDDTAVASGSLKDSDKSWFERLKAGLSKTHISFTKKITQLLGSKKKIDDEFMEELEEILISTDIGVQSTMKIMAHFEEIAGMESITEPEMLMDLIREVLSVILDDKPIEYNFMVKPLCVVLIVGVNGVGKTTTIGKLAKKFRKADKKVVIAAGDTFRAAAIEQLEIWANRVGCDIIKHKSGADPAAVVFDGINAARARKADVLLIDTAGRLHNKANLMEELKKVRRIITREIPDGPHETLLVLDGVTGQNGITQAKAFKEMLEITGIVVTKLDGTAKGGVVVAIKEELKIPVKYIGVGEKIDDLREFIPSDYIQALFY